MIKTILAILGLIFIIAILFFWIRNRDGAPTPRLEPVRYQSVKYGFSFEAPVPFSIHTYSDEALVVGEPQDGGFTAGAEVNVVVSGKDEEYANLDAFILDRAKNMCAADGPNETIYCDRFLQKSMFQNQNGIAGQTFFLNRVHKNLISGQTTSDSIGPFYAFEISTDISTTTYAALIVRPPASLTPNQINPSLVHRVADSVEIARR